VLSVARVTHPIFSESKVGFIVTNGDPTGLTQNTVAGLDVQYRDSNFLPGKILQSDTTGPARPLVATWNARATYSGMRSARSICATHLVIVPNMRR